MSYDSTQDTLKHIDEVQAVLVKAVVDLIKRGEAHDRSKLLSPEKEGFDICTPKLKELVYGSDEYKASLVELGGTLAHHYAVNDHHPEGNANGVAGMTLMSLLEMLCDWIAAVKRSPDGSIEKSLEINQKRFGISDQLQAILANTVKELS